MGRSASSVSSRTRCCARSLPSEGANACGETAIIVPARGCRVPSKARRGFGYGISGNDVKAGNRLRLRTSRSRRPGASRRHSRSLLRLFGFGLGRVALRDPALPAFDVLLVAGTTAVGGVDVLAVLEPRPADRASGPAV